jgi:hypothetical protein
MALVEKPRRQCNLGERHVWRFHHQFFGLSDAHLPLEFARSRPEGSLKCRY